LTSAYRFLRSGNVDLKIEGKLFPFVFILYVCVASVPTFLPAELLKPLVIIILTIVMIYTLDNKDWRSVRTYTKFTIGNAVIFTMLMSLIGFYDGFLGGGTGSFMLFILLMFGFDFLGAVGNAKVLNFASNLGALLLFMILGQVDYFYGLIMAISMICGSYVG